MIRTGELFFNTLRRFNPQIKRRATKKRSTRFLAKYFQSYSVGKKKREKIAFRIKTGKKLKLRLQIFPKQKWEAHHKQQNALVKLKINAVMITKMFDFTAQRKFLWVFRELACDLTTGYFRR